MARKKLFNSAIIFVICIFTWGCSHSLMGDTATVKKNHPQSITVYDKPHQNITENPAKQIVDDRNFSVKDHKESSKGNLTPFIPKFKNLSPLQTQRVSLSFVDEDYKAIFQGLALAGGFNLVILPEVINSIGDRGRITANYTEMYLSDVLNSLCKMLDVYWKVSDGTLYIELLEQRVFHLDFLTNLQNVQYTIGGDVLGGTTGGNNNIVTPLTGNFKIEGQIDKSVTDIYSEIESLISARIGITQNGIAYTNSQPSTGNQSVSQKNISSALTGQMRGNISSGQVQGGSTSGSGTGEGGSYFLNRQTGILMLKARPSAIRDIETYLNTISNKYNRYVLIDARILEIELSNEYRLGIDWKTVEANISKSVLRTNKTTLNLTNPIDTAEGMFSFSLSDRYFDMNILVNALQEFGQIRTLSNPRLKAMNGQTAVMSVGQSISYLRELSRDITDTTSTNINNFDYEVQISSIFDGVLLGVTPVIHENGKVNLHVVPIKSDLIRIDERSFGDSVSYSLPRVNLREASTVLRLNDGEIAILGGFIKEKKERIDSGLPVLQKLPMAGRLFRHEIEQNKLVEMVILLNVKVFSGE